MKKLITLIALAVLALGAQAQVPKYSTATTFAYTSTVAGISNNVALGTCSLIDCSKQRNVGISIVSVADGATSTTVGFVLTPTVDGTTNTALTNLSTTITQALNGTTRVYWGTNLDAQGFKGFLVTQYTNNVSGNVTNTFTYANKISTP